MDKRKNDKWRTRGELTRGQKDKTRRGMTDKKKVNNSNSKRATSRINYNKHVVNINNKN